MWRLTACPRSLNRSLHLLSLLSCPPPTRHPLPPSPLRPQLSIARPPVLLLLPPRPHAVTAHAHPVAPPWAGRHGGAVIALIPGVTRHAGVPVEGEGEVVAGRVGASGGRPRCKQEGCASSQVQAADSSGSRTCSGCGRSQQRLECQSMLPGICSCQLLQLPSRPAPAPHMRRKAAKSM